MSPQVSSLQSKVSGLETQANLVPGLQQQLSSAATNTASLQNQLSSMQGQITPLQGKVTSLQSQLSAKNEEVSSLTTQGLAKDAQITSLQSTVSSQANQITTLKSQQNSSQTQTGTSSSQASSVIAVSFSRTSDTAALLSYWIGRSNTTIRAAVYSFTYDSLGNAIIAAKKRGVDVDFYIDNQYVSSMGSEYPRLLAAGVDVRADTRSADMHHKFIVIDDVIVGTGSFNWSDNAENSNDENLVIIKSSSLAQQYLGEFTRMWSTSTPTLSPTPNPTPTPTPTPTGNDVASTGGTKYHYPSCSYVNSILPENKIYFNTSAEARAAGYTPCSRCNPP